MYLLFSLALRNLFRNVRRTVLTATLISLSLAAMMFTDAFIGGVSRVMIDSATRTFSGDAQLHRRGFRDAFDATLYLNDTADIDDRLQARPEVRAWTARAIVGGMVASPRNVAGGLVHGIDAEREPTVSRVRDALREGRWLSGADGEILLGSELAERLETATGDRIVLTLSEVDGGDLTQALFRVTGIVHFGLREMDDNFVFINLAQAQAVLGLGQGVHQVAVRLSDRAGVAAADPALFGPLTNALSDDRTVAEGWMDLAPEIAALLGWTDLSTLIVGTILFVLAALGIINSLFMSIYERMHEFGVVKAIGTRPDQLLVLVVIEALLLALLSTAAGLMLGGGLIGWFSIHGLVMGDMEVQGVSFASAIPTIPAARQFVLLPACVVGLTVLTSLYPALYAARIVPGRALQRSL